MKYMKYILHISSKQSVDEGWLLLDIRLSDFENEQHLNLTHSEKVLH